MRLPVVILSVFRMRQYRDNHHWEVALHFSCIVWANQKWFFIRFERSEILTCSTQNGFGMKQNPISLDLDEKVVIRIRFHVKKNKCRLRIRTFARFLCMSRYWNLDLFHFEKLSKSLIYDYFKSKNLEMVLSVMLPSCGIRTGGDTFTEKDIQRYLNLENEKGKFLRKFYLRRLYGFFIQELKM